MTFSNREPTKVAAVSTDNDHRAMYVMMEGIDGGWGQGFGGLRLEPETQAAWNDEIAALFGVASIDDIVGRQCFVLRSWPGWGSDIEGLEVDGRRFTITAFRRKHFPDRKWDPLVDKRQQLHDGVAYLARNIQERLAQLQRVEDGYVDWSAAPDASKPEGT